MKERTHPRRDVLSEADAARVAEVFESHRRFVENVARQHAPSPDDVPDIVQAVGVQVCRGLNGFRGESELATWLFRVTVNTARDYYHREQRHLRAVEGLQMLPRPDVVVDPDAVVIAGESLHALRNAVDRLRPSHRATINNWLRNESGEASVEPEEHISEGTLKSRLFRARQQLRILLDDTVGSSARFIKSISSLAPGDLVRIPAIAGLGVALNRNGTVEGLEGRFIRVRVHYGRRQIQNTYSFQQLEEESVRCTPELK